MNIIEKTSPLKLQGISVRTQNQDEQDPSTAKIGKLWARFGQTLGPYMTEQVVYGVYHHYASDDQGFFNVTAAISQTEALSTAEITDLSKVELQPGRYAVFSGQGKMPQVVIALWQDIWTYFHAPNCPHQRTYATDFEHYLSKDNVAIYIGIQ